MIEAGVARRFNVRIPLRDGITLSADLALPEALPAPAVVVRTPYGKTGERNSQRAAMFAKAGYACALVDVRGRGDSDGAFQPYRNDGPDGAEVIGPVKVVAHVATSAADTDITAKLLDVHPGGFAQRLCDGIVRLRYRDGFDAERPVTPGDSYEVEIRMWDTCVRLPAGHRLRVEIASSAFPKYDVNLGTGGDMITETEGVIATNRLWHTPSRPSRLILN